MLNSFILFHKGYSNCRYSNFHSFNIGGKFNSYSFIYFSRGILPYLIYEKKLTIDIEHIKVVSNPNPTNFRRCLLNIIVKNKMVS